MGDVEFVPFFIIIVEEGDGEGVEDFIGDDGDKVGVVFWESGVEGDFSRVAGDEVFF